MKKEDVKYDCRYFEGHIPCKPNKQHDVQCDNCSYYDKATPRILFIKLGAIGDVIRTTPLLTKYKEKYPNCHFTWITHSPQVLPKGKVDVVYKWDATSLYTIANEQFDIAINLDKDKEACMLLANVCAAEKYGFTWKDNHIDIATEKAEHKLITGLFDHISKNNTKNYLEEIFEICHFKFNKEEYMINLNESLSEQWKEKFKKLSNGKTIIGLNTGCGLRWKTRLWPKDYWVELIKDLEKQGYFCLLMG
ncbi:MAG: glycosyltransferase family 9 protein, partial [Flavobacteriales bacterium]